MDAVEYLRAFYKMCDSNKYCSSCEAIGVCQNDCEKAEQMVEIVGKWANEHKVKEHPKKTRQNEFLKMFPNAVLIDGVLIFAPCNVDKTIGGDSCSKTTCEECARKYWTEEIE